MPSLAELGNARRLTRWRLNGLRRRSSTRWPPGRPRVLIVDSWLANAGDGAISIATDGCIRELAPDAAVLHAAYQSDLVGHHYPGLEFVPPLAALVGVVEVPEADGWDADELTAVVADADVVLSQGGGFLIECYGPWQRLDAYERVIELGVPLGFVAQTIGRFQREDKRASLAQSLGSAVVIGVRDRRSVENAIDLGVPAERVRLGADEAFRLFPEPPEHPLRRGVAMVLSQHTLIGEDRFVGEEPDLIEALTRAVRLVADAVNPEVVTLLSTCQGLSSTGRGLEDDDVLASDVVARLPVRVRRRIRRPAGYLSPRRVAGIIARHRALVSMRMHPVIFALSQGVPPIAVTRAHKTVELLSELEIEDALPAWLDPKAIAHAVTTALDHVEADGPQWFSPLERARQGGRVNRDLLAELLAAARTRA